MTVEKIKAINELTQSWMELRRTIEDIYEFPFKYSAPENTLISKYECIAEDILDVIHGVAEEVRNEILRGIQNDK